MVFFKTLLKAIFNQIPRIKEYKAETNSVSRGIVTIVICEQLNTDYQIISINNIYNRYLRKISNLQSIEKNFNKDLNLWWKSL